MSRFARRASRLACDLLPAVLPRNKAYWARAIRAEVDSIPQDRAALLFALDALRGAVILSATQALFASTPRAESSSSTERRGVLPMSQHVSGRANPAHVGMVCAAGAVCLGLAYLLAAEAPLRMLALNASALLIGLVGLMIPASLPAVPPVARRLASVLIPCVLLLTAMAGTEVNGASRWIFIGSLAVQPGLILLPAIIMLFARHRGPIETLGVVIAALAMALQPDRAMAGALLCGLLALVLVVRDRYVMTAMAASAAAFGAAMLSPDGLAGVPYVDQVFYKAFEVHALAGGAVVAGAVLLLVPAAYGLITGAPNRAHCLAFGAIWLAIIAAAALGNYPTPVVGYGGSAILGYIFSLVAFLPAGAQVAANEAMAKIKPRSRPETPETLRSAYKTASLHHPSLAPAAR